MHSTGERLSSYWGRIKDFLLSPIEDEVGPLTNKQQQLITALEVIRIEDFVSPHVGVGRLPRLSDEQAAIFQQFFYAFMDAFDAQYCYAIERHYQSCSEQQNHLSQTLKELLSSDDPF